MRARADARAESRAIPTTATTSARQDGSLQESQARWLGAQLGPPPRPPVAKYRD